MLNEFNIINSGASIKSSIPLVEDSFGKGFGFANQRQSASSPEDKEIEVELSRSAQLRNSADPGQLSASPLLQAVDALYNLNNKLAELQEKYKQSVFGGKQAQAIEEELDSVAEEFKRITSSSVFRAQQSSDSNLSFRDSSISSVYESGDSSRIERLNRGINGLEQISFAKGLENSSLVNDIKSLIDDIKTAIKPETRTITTLQAQAETKNSVLISAPAIEIKTIGNSGGLSLSLIGLNNEDLIKAAATHVNLDAVNVLLLTYDAPEPETAEEKEEREKDQQKTMVEVENPDLKL